jgi:hypothetical protein
VGKQGAGLVSAGELLQFPERSGGEVRYGSWDVQQCPLSWGLYTFHWSGSNPIGKVQKRDIKPFSVVPGCYPCFKG